MMKSILKSLLRRIRLIAANEGAAPAALTPAETRTLLLQVLDLNVAANDQQIRERIQAVERDQQAEEVAANERRQAAFKALGLADTATNEEFHATILAVPAKIAAADDARKQAETSATNERQARAKLLLDVAINEGRLPPSDRPRYETAFNSNFAEAERNLAAEKKKLNPEGNPLGDLSVRKPVVADAQERQATILTAVNERMSKTGEDYSTAFDGVKKDPKFKGVFEAMQKPGAK
jgi:hypothetical protein